MRVKNIIIFFLFIASFNRVRANIFIVTSNAGMGAGTLSSALQAATANGTAFYDTILFNLPGSTALDRTILVPSVLQFSGKLVIDGTSQPGSNFGISDTKVILQRSAQLCAGIYMANISDVQLYGIWFKGFSYIFNLTDDCHGYTIMMNNVNNITIGKQGKANAFSTNNPETIFHKNYFGIDYLNPIAFADTINIGYNIFGLNETADGIDFSLREGMDIWNGRNVTINNNYGNCGTSIGSATVTGNGFIRFTDNNFAISPGVTQSLHGSAFAVSVQGVTADSVSYDLAVTGNKLSNTDQYCIILWDMRGKIIIDHNELGKYYDLKTQSGDNFCIGMIRCKTSDPTQITNNIIQNRKEGIWHTSCGRVFIKNNSIFCNKKGIHITSSLNIPTVSLTNVTPVSVSGTTFPNATVELFLTDTCTDLCENGKLSLGTSTADINGVFNFVVIGTGPYSATTTTADSISSEFNGVKVDTLSAIVKNATCGANNGSITGIHIINASSWHWENDLGQVISTVDTNLVNLPPGKYRLVLNELNVACTIITGFFEILQVPQPVLTGNPFIITQPGCGQPNGKIEFTGALPPFSQNKWLDNSGNVVQYFGNIMNNLGPGQYYFKLYLGEDSLCNSTYGPFILVNQSGPLMNTAAVQFTPALCGNPVGSITGITTTNVTGIPFIGWVDSLNHIVGSTLDLLNMPAGKYKLKFKDQSGCDTIFSVYYIIPAIGVITIDESQKIIHAAGCMVNNGSIVNMVVSGAQSYQWQNVSTGSPAGNTVSISNLPVGNYQLTASNSYGCTAVSSLIVIPQATFTAIDVLTAQTNDASCSQQNGNIEILSFSNDPLLYTFTWIDSTSNQQIGTGTSLSNLGAGTYLLVAKDTNGCVKQVYRKILKAFLKPSFDLSALQVNDDNCSTASGNIHGIKINDPVEPVEYSWLNASGVEVGNNLNLNNLVAGPYRLAITDAFGCTNMSPVINIGNVNTSLSTPSYNDQTIAANSSAQLPVQDFITATYILYADNLGLIELQRNETGVFVTGNLAGDTSFYIKRIIGSCSSPLVQVRIKVFKLAITYVPTAFTPNNDGKNDELKVLAYGPVQLLHFTIYNRYGQVLFTTSDINAGWNGIYMGKKQEQGSYVWMFRAIDYITGRVIEERGITVLLR